jgi:arginyl-tRNA synthetase
MSSRLGNIIPANTVIDLTVEALKAAGRPLQNDIVLGAIKYAFLKNRLGGDLIYDPDESVSLEGNSGPYLQYAHARARSILAKAEAAKAGKIDNFEPGERTLARKLTEYPEVVDKAVTELMPHYVCTYLYELAQTFNRFYENNHVIGDARQDVRLALVTHYADTLKAGLTLLGIASPDKM